MARALEGQVVNLERPHARCHPQNTARFTGQPRRELCIASNRGHRMIDERIAAHDPAGASQAAFAHITEAWAVRRGGSGEPIRLSR